MRDDKEKNDDYDICPNPKKHNKTWGGLEEDRKLAHMRGKRFGPEGYWGI